MTNINITRLYEDLRDHYGTAPYSFFTVALGRLDAAYEQHDWNTILQMAENEGFNPLDYAI